MVTTVTCSLRGYGTIFLKVIEGTVSIRDGYYYVEVIKGTLDNITMSKQNYFLPIHCTIIVEHLA